MTFDFTPPSGAMHGPLSSNFSNEEFAEALNNEYNNNADEWEEKLPSGYKPSSDPSGYLTAAQVLGSWFAQQLPGCNGPGCTQENPYSVPFTDPQKQNFLEGLGNSCNPKDLFDAYNNPNGPRYAPAIANTYFNLGRGEKSFTWENGSLCITDRYNFEGVGDFGVGASTIDNPNNTSGWINFGAKAIIVGLTILPVATAAATARGILEGLGVSTNDPSDPFTNSMRGGDIIGNVAPLFLKNCFSPEEICSSNKGLFTCAARSGKFNTGELSGICFNGNPCVEVGQAQPSPILGFPAYAPTVMEISDSPGSWSFGGSGNYPSPFTSFNQQLVNSNNFLGPYAFFGDIPGRMIIIPSGAFIGELGFICQNWYDFNDGNFARDNNGDLYPTKAKWWDTCLKSEVSARFLPFSSRPLVKVKVATKSFLDNNSPDVFSSDYNIAFAPINSITLPLVLSSLPAATLFLI